MFQHRQSESIVYAKRHEHTKRHNRQVNYPALMSVIGDVCKKAFARAHEVNGDFEAIMDSDNKTSRQEDKLQRTHGH